MKLERKRKSKLSLNSSNKVPGWRNRISCKNGATSTTEEFITNLQEEKQTALEIQGCGIPTLHNFGKSCYVNVILQILHTCPPFRAKLDSITKNRDKFNNYSVSYHLSRLLKQMDTIIESCNEQGNEYCESTIKPSIFMEALRYHPHINVFNYNQEHDAHEFFQELISQLNQECTFDFSTLFQGELLNELRCYECDEIYCSIETYSSLMLNIRSTDCSVASCLQLLLSPEILSGKHKFQCSHCYCKTQAQKQCVLNSLPLILHLHVVLDRLYEPKAFNLDIDKTISLCGSPFSLLGIVYRHSYSTLSGHFSVLKAVNQCNEKKWVHIDDDKVKILQDEDVQDMFRLRKSFEFTGSPYLIFYQRKIC